MILVKIQPVERCELCAVIFEMIFASYGNISFYDKKKFCVFSFLIQNKKFKPYELIYELIFEQVRMILFAVSPVAVCSSFSLYARLCAR